MRLSVFLFYGLRPTAVLATHHRRSRLFTWARGAAVATVAANVAFYVGTLAGAPSVAEATAHPNAFWPGTVAALTLGPLTAALFLLAVALAMEYRVRSLAASGPERTRRLRLLLVLLAPTALQLVALAAVVGVALVR